MLTADMRYVWDLRLVMRVPVRTARTRLIGMTQGIDRAKQCDMKRAGI